MKKFNLPIIFKLLGILLMMNAGFMLLCISASIYFHELEDVQPLLFSGLITAFVGGALRFYGHRNQKSTDLKKRDGYIIVTFGWFLMSVAGSLPYLLSGTIDGFVPAIFETISGFSTTGASVLNDIEGVNKDILLWRSLTQWIGGMGIIVLTVAILPFLGIGGMQLFVAEAPGISPDKLQPRIRETAKRLWLIYVSLTAAEIVFLMIGGMSFYDGLNHALTTMATGGFSTYNSSAAGFSPFIQYVLIFFMFLAGTNFTLLYFGFNGRLRKIWENEEFRFYAGLITVLTVLLSIMVYLIDWKQGHIETAVRDVLFQTVSIITTTGFVSADYTLWPPAVLMSFFALMFVGASAGSTAGGVKIVRHLLLLKNAQLSFKRLLHPKAIIPVRLNGHAVSEHVVFNVLAFIMIYILIYVVGVLTLSVTGLDFKTSLGAVATCLGNIGPGIGAVGPVDNFGHLSPFVQGVLSFYMLVGRLELFTVLMLFTPYFWRRMY